MSYTDPLSSLYQWEPDAFSNQMVVDQQLAGAAQQAIDPVTGQPTAFGGSASSSPADQSQLPQGQTQDPYGQVYVDANGKAHYAPSPIGMPPYIQDQNGAPIPNPGAFVGTDNPNLPPMTTGGNLQAIPPGVSSDALKAIVQGANAYNTSGGRAQYYQSGPHGPGWYSAPRYVQGDEYQAAGLPPDQIASLQNRLAQAGYYGNTPNYIPGVWRSTDASAYREVLLAANQRGQDANTTLNDQIAAENSPAAVAARNQAIERSVYRTPIEVTSGADLTAAARRLAPDVMGRYLTPQEEQQFVKQFQGLQTNDQMAIRQSEVKAQEGKLPNNTVVEKPPYRENANTIENILREQHPVEYMSHQIGTKAQMLLQLMSGQAGIPGHGEEKAG